VLLKKNYTLLLFKAMMCVYSEKKTNVVGCHLLKKSKASSRHKKKEGKEKQGIFPSKERKEKKSTTSSHKK
jgi:hypothetical protein